MGAEAIGLLVRFLFNQRGHHRITIDPAAANQQAIRCYQKVGFRAVGTMRKYERGSDGRFHDGLTRWAELVPPYQDLAANIG